MATVRLVGKLERVEAVGPCGGTGQVMFLPPHYLFELVDGDTPVHGSCYTLDPYEIVVPPPEPLPPIPNPPNPNGTLPMQDSTNDAPTTTETELEKARRLVAEADAADQQARLHEFQLAINAVCQKYGFALQAVAQINVIPAPKAG